MQIALREAEKAAAEDEIPVGAAIFKDGKLLSCAHNERERQSDPTAHAEVLAIRRAAQVLKSRRLLGCTLFVTLEPCAMCAGAAMAAGLEEIVFGAWDDAAGCAGSVYALPEDPALRSMGGARCRCTGGIAEGECARVLAAYFRNKRGRKAPHGGMDKTE